MGADQLDLWFQPQMLRQESSMDCGVPVLGALAGLGRDEILADMPDAVNGKTVDQWETYLRGKGVEVVRHQPGEAHSLPCAHLVETAPGCGRYHWIFQSLDGGIHDPNPAFQHYPPRLITLDFYGPKALSITIRRPGRASKE